MKEQRLLALFILHHRTQQGLTIAELGRRSNLMPSTLGGLELEKNGATFKTTCLVLKGLGKTFTDLDMFIMSCDCFRESPCLFQGE